MLLHRAAVASCFVRPSRPAANVRRTCAVVRPQGISAGSSPPCNILPARTAGAGLSVGAGLSAAGARVAAPAPVTVRILIVRAPAVTCIKHSGDSQEEPADREQPAASQEQPADSKAPADSLEELPGHSKSSAAREEQAADSKVPAPKEDQAAASKAPAASQEEPADSKGPAVFFGREFELQELARLAKRTPGVMRMVLGPRSCGKTCTLTEFQRTRQNVAAINMRRVTASTPAAFARMVLLELAKAAPRTAFEEAVQQLMEATATKQAGRTLVGFGEVVGGLVEGVKLTARGVLPGVQDSATGRSTTDVTFNVGKVAWDAFWSQITQPQPQGDDMSTLTQAVEALVDAWGAKKKQGELQDWPVIIIDEANVLMEWRDKYPSQLVELLRLLIRISKEARLCHVILATSEWGFIGWLQQAIGLGFYKAEVIGDFPEKEAREFFERELQRLGMVLEEATWEATWDKVFEVGGGNAGFLTELAEEVAVLQSTNAVDWDKALRQAAYSTWAVTPRLADGGDALGWTKDQYAAAALALLRNKHHAVPRGEMAQLLGQLERGVDSEPSLQRVAGELVLQKMVAANALALRPLSSWARDVPEEAFPDAADVVTAPSAVSLHCMRRLLQPMEEARKATSE